MTCLFSLQKNVVLYEAFIIVGCSSVSRQQSYTEKNYLGDNYLLSLFNSTSMKQKWIFMLFVTCSFLFVHFLSHFFSCLVTLLNTVLNEFALFRKFESHQILIATRYTRFTSPNFAQLHFILKNVSKESIFTHASHITCQIQIRLLSLLQFLKSPT
jgi:hypothetical protein